MAEILFEILIANGPFPKSARGRAIFCFCYAVATLIGAASLTPAIDSMPIVAVCGIVGFVVSLAIAFKHSEGRAWSSVAMLTSLLAFVVACRRLVA